MARIPQNTITGVPTMVRDGATAAPMPGGGLGRAIEAGAEGMNTQIRREQALGDRRVRRIGAQGDVMLGVIDSSAKFALAINQAKEERDGLLMAKVNANLNDTLMPEAIGFRDDSGAYHEGIFSTPFSPDDDDGNGGTSVQSAMNARIVQWQKDNGIDKLSRRQRELLDPLLKDSIGRWMTKAESIDAQNIRSYYDGVRKANTESSFNTAMAFVLPEDSSSFGTSSAVYASDAALSVIDPRFIKNYSEWVRSPDRDPAKLEFVSPVAKAEYDREYVHALDKVNASRVNALLKMAVDSEDQAASAQIFAFLDDPENPIAFSTEEQRREYEASIAKAKEQRVVVEAGRERQNFTTARDLIARIAIGKGSEDDIANLDAAKSKLGPERVFELDAFRKDFGEKFEYGKWDEYRLSMMESMTPENRQKKLSEMSRYIESIPDPAVRERARRDMAGPGRKAGRITDTDLGLWRRFGGLGKDHAAVLENLSRLADSGSITPAQYVHEVDAMRDEAEDSVNPVGVLLAMKDAGIDAGSMFARDKLGNIRFDSDGRPIEADQDARQRQKGFVSDEGVGFWNRKREYELSEEIILKAYDLAREVDMQNRMGIKGLGTIQDYLKKNLVDTATGKEWSDVQMGLRIDSLRKSLETQYQESLGGYYLDLDQRGTLEGVETDE